MYSNDNIPVHTETGHSSLTQLHLISIQILHTPHVSRCDTLQNYSQVLGQRTSKPPDNRQRPITTPSHQ